MLVLVLATLVAGGATYCFVGNPTSRWTTSKETGDAGVTPLLLMFFAKGGVGSALKCLPESGCRDGTAADVASLVPLGDSGSAGA